MRVKKIYVLDNVFEITASKINGHHRPGEKKQKTEYL